VGVGRGLQKVKNQGEEDSPIFFLGIGGWGDQEGSKGKGGSQLGLEDLGQWPFKKKNGERAGECLAKKKNAAYLFPGPNLRFPRQNKKRGNIETRWKDSGKGRVFPRENTKLWSERGAGGKKIASWKCVDQLFKEVGKKWKK